MTENLQSYAVRNCCEYIVLSVTACENGAFSFEWERIKNPYFKNSHNFKK